MEQEAQCPPHGLQQEREGLASGGSFEAEIEKCEQCVKTEGISLLRTPRISLEDEEYLYRYPSPIYTPEFAWMLGPELQSEGMEPLHSVQNAGQDRPGGVDHDGKSLRGGENFSESCHHSYRRVSHGLGWPANASLFLPIVKGNQKW